MLDLPVYGRALVGPIPGVVLHRAVRADGGGGRVALAHATCPPGSGWVLHAPRAAYLKARDGSFWWNRCCACDGPLVRVD